MSQRKSVEGRASDLLVHFSQRNPPIFEAADASAYLNISGAATSQVLSPLVTRGWITRHRKGVYEVSPLWATSDLPFEPDRFAALARWVKEPYYVAFRSVLELHDWTDYPVRDRIWIAVATPHYAPTSTRDQINWVVMRQDRFTWGLERRWIGDQALWISDPERTILDGLHLPRHMGGISEVIALLVRIWSSLDDMRLVTHTDRLGIEAVRRRLGFLLETVDLPNAKRVADRLFEGRSVERRSPTVLDPSLPAEGKVNRRWGVLVNLEPAEIASAGRT